MDWKRILQAAIVIIVASAVLLNCSTYGRLTTETIRKGQLEMNDRPVGERIAFWAEQFIGTPYDDDAAGAYVTRRKIVADDVADCMYLVYRSTELGSSNTPEEAIRIALTKRFHTQGVLDKGKVVNYEDRFQDGGEMIRSGRWGRGITDELGKTKEVTVTGNECFDILPPDVFLDALPGLKNGDIIFFCEGPCKEHYG